ncbi:MAG: rhodanese-like domain-containing protein [Pseudomonadota bacterium]
MTADRPFGFPVVRAAALRLFCALAPCAAADTERRLTADIEAEIVAEYPDVAHLTVAEYLAAEAAHTADALLIDVRTTAEYRRSRLPGALHAPDAATLDALVEQHADRPLLLYCSVGYRSAAAAREIGRRHPEARVSNLLGSLFDWANRGLPLVNDRGATHRVHSYSWLWRRYVRPEAQRRAATSARAHRGVQAQRGRSEDREQREIDAQR